jgi:hypothetical protein
MPRNKGEHSITIPNVEVKNDRNYSVTTLHAFVAHTGTSRIATSARARTHGHTHTDTHTRTHTHGHTHTETQTHTHTHTPILRHILKT